MSEYACVAILAHFRFKLAEFYEIKKKDTNEYKQKRFQICVNPSSDSG
jgi:hypothetical protein